MMPKSKPGLLEKLRDESGVAMIVVLFAIVVVSVMGGALVVSGVRDLDSSISVQRASTALGIAEAGVQHSIQQLKAKGPIGGDIVRCVPDKSSPVLGAENHPDAVTDPVSGQKRTGWGQFMNPTDRTLAPVFDTADPNRTSTDPKNPPSNCGPYIGNVGNGRYTVFAVGDSVAELIDLPGKRVGTYRVQAVGFDRRDRPGRPGEREVQQNLRIETVDVPYALFAKNSVDMNGTPKVMSESIYTEGHLYWRSKINFESSGDASCPYAQGCDIFYGWNAADKKCSASPGPPGSPCPVAANAVGTIYEGGGGGIINGPIHAQPSPPGPGYANCNYPYDRDGDGGPYPSWGGNQSTTWSCGPRPAPPYSTSGSMFAPAPPAPQGFKKDDFPFDPAGPTEDVYQFLKAIAKSTNTYCDHKAKSPVQIGASLPGLGGDCEHLNDFATRIPPDKFFVMYFDSGPDAGAVSIKKGWGPQPLPGQNPKDLPCTKHFGIIIVRGVDRVLSYENNEAWWGAMFVPEGTLSASGIGGQEVWFIGTVFAKNLQITGNMRFQLNNCWLDSVASPAFFLVSRLRWHEADR